MRGGLASVTGFSASARDGCRGEPGIRRRHGGPRHGGSHRAARQQRDGVGGGRSARSLAHSEGARASPALTGKLTAGGSAIAAPQDAVAITQRTQGWMIIHMDKKEPYSVIAGKVRRLSTHSCPQRCDIATRSAQSALPLGASRGCGWASRASCCSNSLASGAIVIASKMIGGATAQPDGIGCPGAVGMCTRRNGPA